MPRAGSRARVRFDLQPVDYFGFELSNRMKSDAVFEVWERRPADAGSEWIGSAVRARAAELGDLRAAGTAGGDRRPLRLATQVPLPGRAHSGHPVLSRLAFVARYEAVVGYRTRPGGPAPAEDRFCPG